MICETLKPMITASTRYENVILSRAACRHTGGFRRWFIAGAPKVLALLSSYTSNAPGRYVLRQSTPPRRATGREDFGIRRETAIGARTPSCRRRTLCRTLSNG